MSSKALSLVEEFIRSNDPQVRKNALVALAVINDDDSVRLIARTALVDTEATVRKCAEDELVELDDETLGPAVAVATDELKVNADEEAQQRAYAFLGRLRSKGVRVAETDLPWRQLLRLAARMNTHLNPVRNWRLRMRLWKPSLVGILVGSVFGDVWLWLVYSPREQGWRLVMIGVAVAVVLSVGIVLIVFASQRAAPISRQPNRIAGFLSEVCTAGVLGTLSVLPIFLLVLIFQLLNDGPGLTSLFIPLVGLMVGLVRAGTVFSFGVFTNQRWNRFLQVLGGVAFGSLPFGLVLFLVAVPSVYGLKDATTLALAIAWWIHLPLSFGAANAFASVDRESPPSGKSRHRYRALRGLILFMALVLAILLNLLHSVGLRPS